MKKSLSAVDISKKLIWEYIVGSFIFGIISFLVVGFSTKNLKNFQLEFIINIIVSAITVFTYVWISSRKITQNYIIKKEDISIIIRNIIIFFLIMTVIGFFTTYNSYQKIVQEEARWYSFTGEAETFKKAFFQKYGYILGVSVVYDLGLYGTMVFLQRKWLLDVAE